LGIKEKSGAAFADLSALADALVVVPKFDLIFVVAFDLVVVVGALAPARLFFVLLQAVAVLQKAREISRLEPFCLPIPSYILSCQRMS